MTTRYTRGWKQPVSLTLVSLAALMSACGGSDDPVGGGTPPLADADAAFCNGTDYQRVLHAVAGGADGPEATVQDIRTLRVHYRRADAAYAGWGLHLWDSNGIDTSRLPFPASTLAQWGAPIPLSSMPGYTETATEVVFEVPVLNPAADASRKEFKLVIHGLGGAGQLHGPQGHRSRQLTHRPAPSRSAPTGRPGRRGPGDERISRQCISCARSGSTWWPSGPQ